MSVCRLLSHSLYLSLSFSLSLSIYTTEQAYNQTAELAVCCFLNGSLSGILELIFHHFFLFRVLKSVKQNNFLFKNQSFLSPKNESCLFSHCYFFCKNMFLSCFAPHLSILSEQKNTISTWLFPNVCSFVLKKI